MFRVLVVLAVFAGLAVTSYTRLDPPLNIAGAIAAAGVAMAVNALIRNAEH